jgi:hypothetical protein
MADGFELAQINIGRLKHAFDAPQTADFVGNFDRINALAEAQAGFLWRLVGEGGDATDVRAFEDPAMLVNMSVWRDVDALAAFVYRTAPREIMRRRREWFHPMEVFMALWWVPAGHRPAPAEGLARLELLGRTGPTSEAFTLKEPFAAPGAGIEIQPVLNRCA